MRNYIVPILWTLLVLFFSLPFFSSEVTRTPWESWWGLPYALAEILDVILRKLAHLVEYGVLTFLWMYKGKVRHPLGIILAVAIVDESLQALSPVRSSRWQDVLLDICAGILVFIFFRKKSFRDGAH